MAQKRRDGIKALGEEDHYILPESGGRWFERYAEGNLSLHYHYQIAASDLRAADFCAIYERYEPGGSEISLRVRGREVGQARTGRALNESVLGDQRADPTIGDRKLRLADAERVSRKGDHRWGPVLVSIPQLIERPERMTNVEVPSLVWLRVLDDCPCRSLQPTDLPYAALSFPAPAEIRILVNENREGRSADRSSVMEDRQGFDEVVEGRSRVVDDIARHEPPSNRWGRLEDAQAFDVVARSRITIGHDVVRLTLLHSLDEPGDIHVQVVKMFMAPRELGPAFPVERSGVDHRA